MGVLILGINTFYMAFCFFKLFYLMCFPLSILTGLARIKHSVYYNMRYLYLRVLEVVADVQCYIAGFTSARVRCGTYAVYSRVNMHTSYDQQQRNKEDSCHLMQQRSHTRPSSISVSYYYRCTD